MDKIFIFLTHREIVGAMFEKFLEISRIGTKLVVYLDFNIEHSRKGLGKLST